MKSKTEIVNGFDNNMKNIELCGGGIVFYINPEKGIMKFLLLKHKGKETVWDVPKGHLKKHESMEKCATREIVEETGITEESLRLIQKLEHKNIYIKEKKSGSKKTKVVHLFLFEALTDKIILSSEHSKYKWVKYKKLESKLTFPEISFNGFVEALKIITELNLKNNSKP